MTFSEPFIQSVLLQGSWSTWPCTASASAGDSGPSGSWTWRTSATATPQRAATHSRNSPIWASTPARTLSRTIRTRTLHTLAHQRTLCHPTATKQATRCMTLTWTRSALKSTSVDKTYMCSTHHIYAHHRRELHPPPYFFEQKVTGEYCRCLLCQWKGWGRWGLTSTLWWRNDCSRGKGSDTWFKSEEKWQMERRRMTKQKNCSAGRKEKIENQE